MLVYERARNARQLRPWMGRGSLSVAGLVAVAAWALATSAAAGTEADPRSFIARLYGHYPLAAKGSRFDPLGPKASQVFDAPLVSLIRRDRRTARGEVGALDGDPLCDCQDDGGMTWRIAEVVVQGADRAVAEIQLTFPETPKPRVETLHMALVKTASGWRIHDISSPDTPSLRGLLRPADKPATGPR